MKKFLSILFIATISIIASCSKENNPRLPDGIITTPIPLLVQDATSDVLIQNVADFKSKFSVQLYFKNGEKPKKMDIVVAFNKKYDNVKLLKADVTTYPTDVDVTGPQLAALFGLAESDIVPGDQFEIRATLTLNNGRVIEGFTPTPIVVDTVKKDTTRFEISPYGTDASTFPGSNVTITYRAVCPLNLDDFVGTYTLDDPDFWGASYSVDITREDSKLKVTGFVEDPTAVIYLTVDQGSQTLVVDKQVYLATLPGSPYHHPAAEGTGIIDACNNKISLSLENTVDEGSFGSSSVSIHK